MELPKPDLVFIEEDNVNARNLYGLVYKAQSSANNKPELIYGYLLLYPMNATARETVLKELASIHNVHGARAPSKIYELGKMYLDHLIRPFRKRKGQIPARSSPESRPSFDEQREYVKTILKESPTSHAMTKKKALIRDGYHCILNRGFDRNSLHGIKGFADLVFSSWPENEIRVVSTEVAYIFPDGMDHGDMGNRGEEFQKHSTAIFWSILERFGYPNIFRSLNGHNIHRLENVMTLDYNLYDPFDRLELWLEAVEGIPDTYTVKTAYSPFLTRTMNLPARVTFSHQSALRIDPDLSLETELVADLPLPNPEYLHIHACVCKVAHMSGATDYIDYIVCEMEGIDVLAEHGASMDVIDGA